MQEKYKSEDIKVLSCSEAIRFRPRLYFSTCFDNQSLDHLVLEAICHALDEYLDGNCTNISIRLRNNEFSVNYDAGMELEKEIEGITFAKKNYDTIFCL